MKVGSLFSGAGGFDLGFHNADFEIAWQCEIEDHPSSVLERHWPGVKRYKDIRDVNVADLEPVDVLIGGFPCQNLSVAGKREGLAGEQSGLFYELARIAAGLRPRYVVFENVPGLFTSDSGRDFARVLGHLAECRFNGGWRVLSAEGFGVAQHRRRVFGVFTRHGLGIRRVAEILAFSDGVCRDSQASGGKRQGIAGTIGAGTAGSGSQDGSTCITGKLTHALTAEGFDASEDGTGRGSPIIAFGGNRTSGPRDKSSGLNAKGGTGRSDFETETFVFNSKQSGEGREGMSPTLLAMPHDKSHANAGGQMAILIRTDQTSSNGNPISDSGVSPALTQGSVPAVGFVQNQRDEVREIDLIGSLPSEPGMKQQSYVRTFHSTVGRSGRGAPSEVVPTLLASKGGGRTDKQPNVLGGGHSLRRMTPLEWERLQGWPDDFTRYRADGTEIADGPRYRMIGNGVVEPVARWLAERIMRYG